MLDAALHNRLQPVATSSGHAPLVVLSDSLLQPSLAALRTFVHSALVAPPQGSVVLVCAEQQSHRLLPPRPTYDPQRVRVVDGLLAAPFASISTATSPSTLAPCASYDSVDLSATSGTADLVAAATGAIAAADDHAPLLVVLDSANALADELEGGVSDALRVVKACLGALKGRKGARLVVVHHDDFPPCPTSSSSASPSALVPSLLASLLAPTLSPSTLHLSLRPSSHLETLATHYALPLPVAPLSSSSSPTSGSSPDPRAHGMLRALAARAVGDPFVRPRGAEEEDERVELGRARCVVEWSARGLQGGEAGAGPEARAGATEGKGKASAAVAAQARERARERDRVAKGEVPRVVRWGMCGAALGAGGGEAGATVREVGVWEVVDAAAGRAQLSPLASPSPSAPTAPSTSSPHPVPGPPPVHPSAAPAASASPLTFSLSDTLTPAQLAARAAVPNPFAHANLPIYGQEGYVVPVLPGALREGGGGGGGTAGGGGGIEYTPDRGDDWDEEDPDGDLEL
ncbi:uncharacterized protein RHOBADRAFT_52228 [Rhodotorula graminis WP1]|uniref:Elongator complex protein 5 n=1 Tax=Rhodotorula graminis (strain WP1) TaxID=578459 RepID=A0A194S9V8_RHOGW|nr:uncharacterized protein RHOBADRAFT_52228 [Rhodotorula graminis WP1]KPV76186.1 hypothetical protein RHOBADRAFT_52228 [Rhodotorula graminis WP1]